MNGSLFLLVQLLLIQLKALVAMTTRSYHIFSGNKKGSTLGAFA
jgi:hypothetical protein